MVAGCETAEAPVLLLTTHLNSPASDSVTSFSENIAELVLLGAVESGSHASPFDPVLFFCHVYVRGTEQLASTHSVRVLETTTEVSVGCSLIFTGSSVEWMVEGRCIYIHVIS